MHGTSYFQNKKMLSALGGKMKCDVCGETKRSFYVFYKEDGSFGVRCIECDYKNKMEKQLCLKKK